MKFLRAEWRNLVMLNWQVSPELLAPLLPRGVEFDFWHGETFISLVGFQFLRTRVLGLPIPFHINFEEVNLRFYVQRTVGDEVRRGVVFIKEFVPRKMIALAARALYNENYFSAPMSHSIESAGETLQVRYAWRTDEQENLVQLDCGSAFQELQTSSREEFIAEHYWGYCRQRDNRTAEYRVEHPRWRISPATKSRLTWDPTTLYGKRFGDVLQGEADFCFIADGSPVSVGFGSTF